MNVSRKHLDYLTFQIYRTLKENPRVPILNADLTVAVIRSQIVENLRIEQELEKEAEAMLKSHRREIIEQGADYRKLVREGMKTLARKKGFTL
ncbi:MAG: hypothetical protein PWP23_2625 [Candidatus Sumerlaeota bacterium]|nr:hypothetical protein [Candidatus Sumerlaeota bacterium]